MAELSHEATATWQDSDFARAWAQRDTIRDLLDLPRRIAAAVIADDNPELGLVVDIGSGPGDFLTVFLEEFPSSRGVWTDVSIPMFELAKERLARFGDRVEMRMVDMTDLGTVPSDAELVMSSRAAHHLDRAALLNFYAEAASHLAPGGWLVNLDHVGLTEPWNTRVRTARKRFRAAPESGQRHHHNYPLPSVQDHLDGYAVSGISDVQVVWRAFHTCLFMGRREN